MSSTLSIVAREDVLIDPQASVSDPEVLQEVYRLLQATCADVAQSPSQDWNSFAESSIYAAYISKLVPAVSAPNEDSDFEDYEEPPKNGWGVTSAAWFAPVRLGRSERPKRAHRRLQTPYSRSNDREKSKRTVNDSSEEDTSSAEQEAQERAHLLSELRRRLAPIPADERNPGLAGLRDGGGYLGALLKYELLVVKRDGAATVLCHVFLTDSMLLFVTESGAPQRISQEDSSNSPLHADEVVQMSDVTAFSKTFTELDGQSACGLELTVRRGEQHQLMTIIFKDEAMLSTWKDAMNKLTFVIRSPDAVLGIHPSEGKIFDEFVDLQTRVMQWMSWLHPGSLQKYAIVSVKSSGSRCRLGAYLCDNGIAFVYENPSITKKGSYFNLKQFIPLYSVRSVAQETEDTIYLTMDDDGDSKLFTFTLEPPARPLDWLLWLKTHCPLLLHTQVRIARPTQDQHPWHTKHPLAPKPLGPTWHIAGGVALSPCPTSENEYILSVAVLPAYESDGLATQAVANALSVAFDTLGAHRVQARVAHAGRTEHQARTARAIRKLVHLGFTHEGIQRRAVMHPAERAWADASVLAMLDSDWLIRESVRAPSATLWDEMFARHQREREALLRWDGGGNAGAEAGVGAGGGLLKRTKSTETVRMDEVHKVSTPNNLEMSVASDADGKSVASFVPPPSEGVESFSSWEDGDVNPDVEDDGSEIEPIAGRVARWTAQQAAVGDPGEWDHMDTDMDDNKEKAKA
ncbi:hypothetical protein BKA62DRAFT_674150 [Auriculariales sp. MPI-PUGE-AT-0066]|nr:hypothetical protein BKA62DRAFT_674150 [Auriculariales sp. MPI-PUGE-AT-0066]